MLCYAKSLQLCPTLCDPKDGSPPGSPIPGILQARTLEWVAISFSNAWKWKVKWSRSVVSDSYRPHGLQPTRLLRPWDFPGKSTGVGSHSLLQGIFPTQRSNPGLPHWGGLLTVWATRETQLYLYKIMALNIVFFFYFNMYSLKRDRAPPL